MKDNFKFQQFHVKKNNFEEILLIERKKINKEMSEDNNGKVCTKLELFSGIDQTLIWSTGSKFESKRSSWNRRKEIARISVVSSNQEWNFGTRTRLESGKDFSYEREKCRSRISILG